MTFEDFCNWYRFDDVVMGLYAIVVASSMEETESSIDCPSCRRQFNIKYNNKALLDLSGVSDTLKKRVTDIDEARVSREAMEKIHEECSVNHRFKSPFTENIYELGNPTIAEARKRFVEINNAKEDFEMTGKASDLFLYVGGTSDQWVEDALINARNEGIIAIDMMDVLEDRLLTETLQRRFFYGIRLEINIPVYVAVFAKRAVYIEK